MSKVTIAVLIASGVATRYDPGVMDTVVANRIMWGEVDPTIEVKGYIALLDCKWKGHIVAIEAPDGRIIWPVMVADCAAAQDRRRLIQTGFAVDLSWELAQELGVIDDKVEGFKVWTKPPRKEIEDVQGPNRYSDWTGSDSSIASDYPLIRVRYCIIKR